jgi:hypothetical protein
MMLRIFHLLFALVVILPSAWGQINFTSRDKYIQINKFLSPSLDSVNDISYVFLVPQYEDEQDPNNQVTLEIYSGVVDESLESDNRLAWLKDQLQQDKRLNPDFSTEIIAYGADSESLQDDSGANYFINKVKLDNTVITYDSIPEGLEIKKGVVKTTSYEKDSEDRAPAMRFGGRELWTLIRFTSITGGTFASLYYSKDVDPMVAFSVGFAGGIASGALTYFSGKYGQFLTNGSWAKWLIESESIFAKGFRKSIGINGKSFSQMLVKQKNVLTKKYPSLANNPELFDKMVWKSAQEKFNKSQTFRKSLLGKLGKADEYIKWWATDVLYTAVAIKAPQAIAGIGSSTSLLSATGSVLSGATMGVIAQGPGDIAIQIRKYQKVEELQKAVMSGKKVVENKAALLDEIQKVLAKEGKHANYFIHDGSHKALRRIENWARSRATMLSFFSVVGVGMEIAGVPMARPLLLSVSAGGAFYYAQVNGAFTEKTRVGRFTQKMLKPFKEGFAKLRPLNRRHCANNFLPTVRP